MALGNRQEYGVNFDEKVARVGKMTIVRLLLALASSQSWTLFQIDVKNAFLYGDFQEEVFMRILRGLDVSSKSNVCQLRRSLYGLKQAPRTWFEKLRHSTFTSCKIRTKPI